MTGLVPPLYQQNKHGPARAAAQWPPAAAEVAPPRARRRQWSLGPPGRGGGAGLRRVMRLLRGAAIGRRPGRAGAGAAVLAAGRGDGGGEVGRWAPAGAAMRTEISTAAAFVTRLLRAAGGIGEEQLRCFRECLQEALRGERGRRARAGPVGRRCHLCLAGGVWRSGARNRRGSGAAVNLVFVSSRRALQAPLVPPGALQGLRVPVH